MKHITQDTLGGPEVLKLVNALPPTPGPGDVLLQVTAAGVNPVDTMVRAGDFPLLGDAPFTLGWDLAGTVAALGHGVTEWAIGDRVFGLSRFPDQAAAYAEQAVVPAAQLAKIPKALSDPQAGAMPMAALTAWQGLVTEGGLKPSQRVLIHGGAGGVGHLAVQIAKALGAYVVSTASPAKLKVVRELGADEVFDYTAGDFTSLGASFDLVFDPQSATQGEHSLAVTKPGGTLIGLLPFTKAAQTKAKAEGKRAHGLFVSPDGPGLTAVAGLVDQGKLRVIVAKSFALARVGAAYDFLATRPVGKVVLLP